MAALNLRQRQALRYADAQNTARHDMRAAEGEFRATVTRHPSAPLDSSSPTFQRWFEDRGGWAVCLGLVLAAVWLASQGVLQL